MLRRILAILFGEITSLRNFLYDRGVLPSYHSSLPVISVGNITAGGNGKTPLALHICSILQKEGQRPVLLSRGYGGSLAGPALVDPVQHSAREVGDEPFMLAALFGLTVVVARRRAAGARFIEQRSLGDVIVLDDGFQHRALRRTRDIVAVYLGDMRAAGNFKQGMLLPFGRFRERKARGLERADAIVFSSRSFSPVDRELLKIVGDLPRDKPLFFSHLMNPVISNGGTGEKLEGGDREIDAFCALAHPESFFASLEGLGFSVTRKSGFPDHHVFTEQELLRLQEEAAGRPLITTSKDWVRLPKSFQQAVYILNGELAVEPKEDFRKFLLESFS